MIKSVYSNQTEIIKSISDLYIGNGFDLDPTYNKGLIHKELKDPELRFDKEGCLYGVETADCRNLPVPNCSVKSIMFDPPFLGGGGKNGIMNKKYSSCSTINDLLNLYYYSIKEFYRCLGHGGFLVFKCQDIANGRTQTFSHSEVYKMALSLGFYARDLFILVANNRMKPHNMVNQHHARKFHSYFWVFEKCRKKNKVYEPRA